MLIYALSDMLIYVDLCLNVHLSESELHMQKSDINPSVDWFNLAFGSAHCCNCVSRLVLGRSRRAQGTEQKQRQGTHDFETAVQEVRPRLQVRRKADRVSTGKSDTFDRSAFGFMMCRHSGDVKVRVFYFIYKK